MKPKTFTNMISYVRETLDSFDVLPFGELDSLVLSWLCYLRFKDYEMLTSSEEGMNVKDLFKGEDFSDLFENVKYFEDTMSLLAAVVASPRFRNMNLLYYQHELDHDTSEQFAAVTFRLKPDLHYIAFRGTDCTITGWKEDFRLALQDPVPSQKQSLSYLQKVTDQISGRIITGGHSKGGNLAVYSAANTTASIQEQITDIYSHDGPGFSPEELAGEGFQKIQGRIHKTLPKSSVFGMIFEQECDAEIIESNAISVMQHNPFTWATDGIRLVRCDDLTPDAKIVNKKISSWLADIPEEERALFIEKLFSILDETKAESFDEFGANLKTNIPIVLRSIADLSLEEQLFMLKTIGKLF